MLHVPAEHWLAGIEADLAADLASNDHVVAGQDLDRDPMLAQRGDCRSRSLLRRIEKGEEALHDKGLLVVLRILLLGIAQWKVARRDRDDAEAVLVVLARDRHEFQAQDLVERFERLVEEDK